MLIRISHVTFFQVALMVLLDPVLEYLMYKFFVEDVTIVGISEEQYNPIRLPDVSLPS